MKSTRRILAAVALAAALATSGAAVAQATSAAIQGKTDPEATVVIRNAETGFVREIKPNASGKYQLRNLQMGTYLVTIRKPDGTETPTRTVSLRVGQTARIQEGFRRTGRAARWWTRDPDRWTRSPAGSRTAPPAPAGRRVPQVAACPTR